MKMLRATTLLAVLAMTACGKKTDTAADTAAATKAPATSEAPKPTVEAKAEDAGNATAPSAEDAAAPAEPETANPTEGPKTEIKVLNAGADPKVQLRLKPAKDSTQAAMMTMTMALEMDLGGQKVPVAMPPMKMGMSTNVTNVSDTGDASFTFKVDSAEIAEGSAAQEQVVSAMKAVIGKVVGMGGESVIDARGAVKSAKFILPPDAPADVRQIVDGFQQSLNQMSIPLPEEAVGAGAMWQAKMTLEQNGMKIDQTATFELVSVEGNTLKVKFTIQQTAPVQEVKTPDMPAGAAAKLLDLKGSGQGEATYDLTKILPVTTVGKTTMSMSMEVEAAGQKQTMSIKMDLDLKFEPSEGGAVKPEEAKPADGAVELLGVASCDTYLKGMTACIEKMPEAGRGPAKDAMAQVSKSWKDALAGAGGGDAAKSALDTGCKSALDQTKKSLGALCPDVKWE